MLTGLTVLVQDAIALSSVDEPIGAFIGRILIAAISFLGSLMVKVMLGFGTFQNLCWHSASMGATFGQGISAILPVVPCLLITVGTMLVIIPDGMLAMILWAVVTTVAYPDVCVAKEGIDAEQIAGVLD